MPKRRGRAHLSHLYPVRKLIHLILASTSARRKELLSLLRIEFETVAPNFTEQPRADLLPDEQVQFFAEGKARSCARQFPDAWVLGSDTLIVVDGVILGKPADRADARAMLCRLRGREHVIHTGVALVRQNDGVRDGGVETVRVWMKAMSDEQVEAYLQIGEYTDKAGAYAIQGHGGQLIARIEGDFTAVVGLPLRLVAHTLSAHGVPVPVPVGTLYREQPYPNWARFSAAKGA